MSEEQQLALALQMSMQGAGLEAMSGLLQSDGAEPGQEEQVHAYTHTTLRFALDLRHVFH